MRLAVSILVVLCLAAGTAAAGELTFGVKAGMIMASVSDDPIVIEDAIDWDTEGRTGMIGGVFLNYSINEYISLHPELLFAMRGFKVNYSEEEASLELTGKMNYIEIPLLAKFNVPMESPLVPCFYAGPSIGLNLSSDVDGNMTIWDTDIDMSADYSDVTSKIDFGLVFGLGMEYEAGAGFITLDIRYNLGLSSFIKDGEVDWKMEAEGEKQEITEKIEDLDSKNRAFVIMLGYTF